MDPRRSSQWFCSVLSSLALGCGGQPNDDAGMPGGDDASLGVVQQAHDTIPNQVLLERVRSCRNGYPWPCNSAVTSGYSQWDAAGVAEEKQKRTFIARISDPARFSVDFLVFTAAGQQFDVETSITAGGNASDLTGQLEGYKNGFSRTDEADTVAMGPSLTASIIDEHWFPVERSFVGSAWDARFNHGFTTENKRQIVNAYVAWLESQINVPQVQMVYLAGHSRGGCLVLRVAQQLNTKYPDLPIIVHSFDGVCKSSQNEFGTMEVLIDNPVSNRAGFWAYATDVTTQFPHPQALAILHLAGGEPVVLENLMVHTFSHREAAAQRFTNGWYTQEWFDVGHVGMDNFVANAAIRGVVRNHFTQAQARFTCPADQRWTRTGCRNRCAFGYRWTGSSCVVQCTATELPRGAQCCSRTPYPMDVCPYVGGIWENGACLQCRG